MRTRKFTPALSVLCWFCLNLPVPGIAQTVPPVWSQTSLQAPYYYKLHHWSAMPANRLQVRIRLLDTRVEQATLYLKMKMVSENLCIENSRPIPIPVSLSGGEEIEIDAFRLGPYFQMANLTFSGKSRNDFLLDGGLLPDGHYRLHFEAYEARSGNKVSIQEMPAVFTLRSGDPPLLNTPVRESTIYYGKQTAIRFQWTPRHLASAGAFRSEYLFELREIPEGVVSWRDYFHTLPSVYQESSERTYTDYGPEQPQLIPGKRYAFRVRAVCESQDGESLNIKNDGYSEVHMFYFEENCPSVPQLRIEKVTSKQALISWTEVIEAREYKLQYRKNGKPDARWFNGKETLQAGSNQTLLDDLEPATGYECRLNVQCDYSPSDHDVIYRFTTLSDDNAHLQCGKHPSPGTSEKEQTPLESLRRFDQVRTANGFVFEIEEASGNDGIFSGSAYTHIPLLANTGVKVKFKNVFINKNYELVSGTMVAETDKNSL